MSERFLNLIDGVAMVVTDLHGDRDAFDRYIACFRTLYQSGQAQRLVLLGDLVHSYGPPSQDGSLSMVLDTMALQQELDPDTVIMLLGNHEMPHIYGVSLSKGSVEFTPRLEHKLGPHREKVLNFFHSLPFYLRTSAGVMLSHAGPSLESIGQADLLRYFNHRVVIEEAERVLAQSDDLTSLYRQYYMMSGAPYDEQARYYLAISGPEDPRYPHLLRAFLIANQSQPFRVLWDALFTQNEIDVNPATYEHGCQRFLTAFSADAPVEQRVMVSGHIVTPDGGHAVVNDYHLRLSSAAHARPRSAGEYLLLDCAKPVESAKDLLGCLHTVFNSP
jgi:hypothetical protein